MNQRQAIIAAVISKPGSNMREVAAAIGIDERTKLTCVSAQLSQLCIKKKLRKDSPHDPRRNPPRYWPTDIATLDLRKLPRTPSQRAQHSDASLKREAVRRAKREASEAKRAAAIRQAAPAKPAKPSMAQHANLSSLFLKASPRSRTPRTGVESVEQFVKRGGQIERLQPGACSRPLASLAGDDDTNFL